MRPGTLTAIAAVGLAVAAPVALAGQQSTTIGNGKGANQVQPAPSCFPNCQGANLRRANLYRANLTRANLRDAGLTRYPERGAGRKCHRSSGDDDDCAHGCFHINVRSCTTVVLCVHDVHKASCDL